MRKCDFHHIQQLRPRSGCTFPLSAQDRYCLLNKCTNLYYYSVHNIAFDKQCRLCSGCTNVQVDLHLHCFHIWLKVPIPSCGSCVYYRSPSLQTSLSGGWCINGLSDYHDVILLSNPVNMNINLGIS